MSIKMKPDGEIIVNLGLEPNGPAHKYLADQAKFRMNDKYVPEKSRTLINTSRVDYNDCSIHYNQLYAGYQYYGQRKDGTHVIQKHTKAGTGPYWDKLMMSAEGKDLTQDVQDFVRGKK